MCSTYLYWCKVEKLIENAKTQDGGYRKQSIRLFKCINLHDVINLTLKMVGCYKLDLCDVEA